MKFPTLVIILALMPNAFADLVRFRTLCPAPIAADAPLMYLPKHGGTPTAVELPSANFSREHYPSSTKEIRFFIGDPSPDSAAAAVAKIPDGVNEAIIMLLPDGTPGRYRSTVFDASLATFRGGDQQFLNLSTETVGVDLGGEKITLLPGKTGTIRKPMTTGAARQPLQMFRRADDIWQRFSATRVPLDPRIRSLVLIYSDPAEMQLRAKAIQDRVDQPEELP